MVIVKPKSEQIRNDFFLIENTLESLGWIAKVVEVHEHPHWTQVIFKANLKPKSLSLKKALVEICKSLKINKDYVSFRQLSNSKIEVIIDHDRYDNYPIKVTLLDKIIHIVALITVIITYISKFIYKKILHL